MEGAGPPGCRSIVYYCCTRVLLYAKMLKETEKHSLFCQVFIIGVISIGGGGPLSPPLATPMSERWALALCHTVNSALVIALRS